MKDETWVSYTKVSKTVKHKRINIKR